VRVMLGDGAVAGRFVFAMDGAAVRAEIQPAA
jgi:hypothetical protein